MRMRDRGVSTWRGEDGTAAARVRVRVLLAAVWCVAPIPYRIFGCGRNSFPGGFDISERLLTDRRAGLGFNARIHPTHTEEKKKLNMSIGLREALSRRRTGWRGRLAGHAYGIATVGLRRRAIRPITVRDGGYAIDDGHH